MASCEGILLKWIAENGPIEDSSLFANLMGLDHLEVVGTIKSLSAAQYLLIQQRSIDFWTLTEEAKQILDAGVSPEFKVWQAISEEGVRREDAEAAVGKDFKIGFGQAMGKDKRWIRRTREGLFVRTAHEVEDVTVSTLSLLREKKGAMECVPKAIAEALKKRKLLLKQYVEVDLPTSRICRRKVVYECQKGPKFRTKRVKEHADLTVEMLETGEWESASFKPYNLKALGAPPSGGLFHPLMKVREEFRRILLDMGFEEMPTGRFVETSFWNFDALFQPQSHPARDAHDTFFIKEPSQTKWLPEEYLRVVKETHEKGGFGSFGYNYDWKREEAEKNLLRTHTTAISAQVLYRLAREKGGFRPRKFFSVDRVFRNESLDATHLAEFHQVEGMVVDRDLSLANLIGIIRTFFNRIGIKKIRFKPAYNPYTEPSMEIFGYHPVLKCWTEIGNSGMFRPEVRESDSCGLTCAAQMLRPMGLPEDVRVLAWGLSLERPTMIKYGIDNIRTLFGHSVKLEKMRRAPICRYPSDDSSWATNPDPVRPTEDRE